MAVSLTLPWFALVMYSVVLDDDPKECVNQVAARDEMSVSIDDVDVDGWLGQAREQQHQPNERFHRRLDSFPRVRQQTANSTHAVEAAAICVFRQRFEGGLTGMRQPVHCCHERDEAKLGGRIDQRAIRTDSRHGLDWFGPQPTLAAMQQDTVECRLRRRVRAEVQRPCRTDLDSAQLERRGVACYCVWWQGEERGLDPQQRRRIGVGRGVDVSEQPTESPTPQNLTAESSCACLRRGEGDSAEDDWERLHTLTVTPAATFATSASVNCAR